MILLSDIFRLLASGEYAGLPFSKNGDTINEKDWRTVSEHLNLGIVEIHKRLKLYEREIELAAVTTNQLYYIRPQYVAVSEAKLSEKQYLVKPGTYAGQLNLVEVIALYNSEGTEVKMNRRGQTPTVKQMSHDTLKITGLTANERFTVVYQSYPDKIQVQAGFDISSYVVYIPDTILTPLLAFVAHRAYKPTGTNDSTANADKSQSYLAQFELAMTQLKTLGLDIPDDAHQDEKFQREGWA